MLQDAILKKSAKISKKLTGEIIWYF